MAEATKLERLDMLIKLAGAFPTNRLTEANFEAYVEALEGWSPVTLERVRSGIITQVTFFPSIKELYAVKNYGRIDGVAQAGKSYEEPEEQEVLPEGFFAMLAEILLEMYDYEMPVDSFDGPDWERHKALQVLGWDKLDAAEREAKTRLENVLG